MNKFKLNFSVLIISYSLFIINNKLFSNAFVWNKYAQINEINCTDFNSTCNQCIPGQYFNNCELFLIFQ